MGAARARAWRRRHGSARQEAGAGTNAPSLPVSWCPSTAWTSPPSVLGRLSVGQVRALVGNSMHVAQIGAFAQFALAARTWSSDQ